MYTIKSILHLIFQFIYATKKRNGISFFLVIDPFRQRGIASHLGDTIIFYLMVPTFLGFYFELFIVWSGINSVFVNEKLKKCYKCTYSILKTFFTILVIFVYPLVIVICFFFSRRSTSNARGSLMIILFSILLLLILGFTIYLIFNLKSKIYKLFKDEDRDNFDIKIIKATKIKNEKNDEIQNKDDIINFLTEIQKTDGLKVIDSVLTTNVQYLDDFEYKFFYDQEKMHLQFNLPNNQERDNMNTNANEETQLNQKKQIMRTNSNISMNNQPKMNFLTATDKRVVLKVFGLTTTFMILSFCILAFVVTLTRDFEKGGEESKFIMLLYFSFALEVGGVLTVYKLFYRSMTIVEYQNLKIIGEIDKYVNPDGDIKNKEEMKFDEFTSSMVFNRFKQFIKSSQK